MQPHLDRPFAHVQPRGERRLRRLLEMVGHNHGAGIDRQEFQGAVQQPGELVALQGRLRREEIGGRYLRRARPRAGEREPREQGTFLPAPPPPAQADVARDPRQPSEAALRVAQGARVLPGIEEHLLGEILRRRHIAGQPSA